MVSRSRKLLFALVPLAALLLTVEGGVRWLEARGTLDTRSPDDAVQYVIDELFERSGAWIHTTRYAETTMVPGRFRAEKPDDGWRVMVVGGSFALGSPFVHPDHGRETAGGITSWMRASLHARYPNHTPEVINLGSGGQDSNRVRRIALSALAQSPDVLVVATCNNEGFLPPGTVSRHLRKLGGYRLLVQLLRPTPDPEDRPLHTLQHPDVAAIEKAHRTNLEAIRDAAAARGVRVLFATLPVNLRYTGTNQIHQVGSAPAEDGTCVSAGRAHYESGDFEAAITALSACEDVPEALRWTGFSLLALERPAEAKAALEAALELAPYNRCRPSFNNNIRAVAAQEAPGAQNAVALADLEARAIAESPSGFPGSEVFVDYCHMTREGYGTMADEILRAIEREGWLPDWPVDATAQAAWERAVAARGMAALEPVHDQLTWAPSPTE